MNSIGIIGFGRFGKILANILQKGFAIKAYDPKPIGEFPGVEFTDLESILKEKVIFVAVPIRQFESLVKEISPHLSEGTMCALLKHIPSKSWKIIFLNISASLQLTPCLDPIHSSPIIV